MRRVTKNSISLASKERAGKHKNSPFIRVDIEEGEDDESD